MEEAIHAYRMQIPQPGGKILGYCSIVGNSGLSHSTLAQIEKGGRSLSKFNASKQLLSPKEDRMLLQYLL